MWWYVLGCSARRKPLIVAPVCPRELLVVVDAAHDAEAVRVDAQDVDVVRKPLCGSDNMLVYVRRKGPGGLVHEMSCEVLIDRRGAAAAVRHGCDKSDAKCLERLGGWIR